MIILSIFKLLNMPHLLKKLREEILNIIPAIIYFCIAFNLIHFAAGLMLLPDRQHYFTYTSVNIGALIVGKVLIIVNNMPFINAFPKKPLIYNILWKFFLYSLFVFIFKIGEIFFHLLWEKDNSIFILDHLKNEFSSPIFWATALMLFMVLFVFVVFNEFTHRLGRKKVLQILFEPPPC